MGMPAVKVREGGFSYADLRRWPEGERWELIEGVAHAMSPAPSRLHQRISGNLFLQLASYLRGRTCQAYHAPFDVRLADPQDADEQVHTVVQPDLVVVCDPEKLDERGCLGAPSLVVEILSPNTAKKDLLDKFLLYERSGVREYWIIQPVDGTISVYRLQENGRYGRQDVYAAGDHLAVELLGDLCIEVDEVFAD